ncbi:hypothetical protein N7510_008429 [Penicillium lagena]|uniref:uncharacterized protein n=1 Tax=Penicillium lagena TaxID=94218 RepID=UPI002541FB8E|nr:uncharacterized protein N7510_008429 [Penicillium lagena]KAJ5605648.1 hypothetical protein N7510_008429 [Penicillium lagena]
MSYDRVLPNPAALRYDSAQVPLPRSATSSLLDHKIMNDVPRASLPVQRHHSDGGLVGRSTYRYADESHEVPYAHQPMSSIRSVEKIPSPNGSKAGPMTSIKELPLRERSSSSSASSTSPVKQKDNTIQFCLCQPEPKIPRPRNAFILYRQHYQAVVVAHNPGLANPEISKIIGEQWRSLSEEEKAKWKALAEEEKARHQQQYPDYRYQPRRYGRDGNSRNSTSGISHNPSGASTCNRCGGRVMNAPSSPMTPFTLANGAGYRASSLSGPSAHPNTLALRSSHGGENDTAPEPIKVDPAEARATRPRQWEENGSRSSDNKRRRVSHQATFKPSLPSHRDRSPEPPHPISPYSARSEMAPPRNIFPILHPERSYGSVSAQGHPDPSLKLPPLQTTSLAMTPMTPLSQDGPPSVEATVMTISPLNKIKVLAKISPPLVPSFRETNPQSRGPVIAVDGQDPELVQIAVEYLERLLKKEAKYQVRVFEGPEIQAPRQGGPEAGQMGDGTVEYLNTISAWHRISDEVISFVKSTSSADSSDGKSTATDEESTHSGMSPKTIIPKTANMQIHSPAHSSENGSEGSVMSSGTAASHHSAVPISLVPRYQLSTADAFACSIPIADSYAPLDHWQWMASLWRACVGPDITVYIRECTREELDGVGGNPVEIRLQDARTVVLRKVLGTARELEEKALKRVGFEIEDYLTQ